MTEVSVTWLDRVVTARQRSMEAYRLVTRLATLVRRGDDTYSAYSEGAEAVLTRDGTGLRVQAIRNRLTILDSELRQAEGYGGSVGSILLGLTEVIDALNETILNTEALLADVESPEDPFIDRLEEHPAYERN